MSNIILFALSGVIGIGLVAHIVSCLTVIWRFRRVRTARLVEHYPALTVLRPVCGLDEGLETTLASTFTAHGANYEVIFCVAQPTDPAIPLIRKLIASHPKVPARLLIGWDAVSGNPKLNNLVKGWKAASHAWIAMIDSNVLLPPTYIHDLFSSWREDTGLVSSPPIGIQPEGLWASVECAVLNGYQARWQLAGDQLGNGFAQGKVLFWRRNLLDQAGGPAALGRELAEDVAATKIVRARGCKVSLVRSPFPQPIYRRTFNEVWQRQVRWARVRRAGFPALFALEIVSGGFLPLAATAVLAALGAVPMLAIPAALAVWYGLEWAVATRAHWPTTVIQVPVWILRDMLIPAVWLASYGSRGFVWRGTRMDPGEEPLVVAE
jgi:ceramide glucosyltransferase